MIAVSIHVLIFIVRLCVAIPAGLVFLLCAVGNWGLFFSGVWAVLRRRSYSFSLFLPGFGAIAGILFLLTLPVDHLPRYWWVALIFDPTWIIAVRAIIMMNRSHPQAGADHGRRDIHRAE